MAIFTEPGRGRKQCPSCKKYIGVRNEKCEGCGQTFDLSAPAAPKKQAVFDEPGRGRKQCAKCEKFTGYSADACPGCGNTEFVAKKQPEAAKPDPEAEQQKAMRKMFQGEGWDGHLRRCIVKDLPVGTRFIYAYFRSDDPTFQNIKNPRRAVITKNTGFSVDFELSDGTIHKECSPYSEILLIVGASPVAIHKQTPVVKEVKKSEEKPETGVVQPVECPLPPSKPYKDDAPEEDDIKILSPTPATLAAIKQKEEPKVEKCPCGEPLHYTDEAKKQKTLDQIKEKGEFAPFTHNNIKYLISRHYLALHSVKPTELETLAKQGVVKKV